MYREASERAAGRGAFFSSELYIPYTPPVAANLPASSSWLDIIVSCDIEALLSAVVDLRRPVHPARISAS